MDPRLVAIAASQKGVFSAEQALDCGYSRKEISRHISAGLWHRLRRGVYTDAEMFGQLSAPARHVLQTRAVMQKADAPAVASHMTAAAVHGVPLLDEGFDLVHVTRSGRSSTRTEAGVVHHVADLPDEQVAVADGIPVTTGARTAIDIARVCDFRRAVVAADGFLRQGLATQKEMQAVAEACSDWPGARTAGRAAAFASPLSETVGESVSRVIFVEQALPEPELQVEIYDEYGLAGRVDFLWRKQRTIGEFDGRIKYADNERNTLYAEKQREDRLRMLGFEVVRFGWGDLMQRPDWIGAQIRKAFLRAGRQGVPAIAY